MVGMFPFLLGLRLRRPNDGEDRTRAQEQSVRAQVDILAAGADDFLAKPFLMADLEKRIKRLLRFESRRMSAV